MQMSFLCSIGHLVTCSGMRELPDKCSLAMLSEIILTVKTISSTVCGHMLIDATLITILVANTYHIPLNQGYRLPPNGTHQVLVQR